MTGVRSGAGDGSEIDAFPCTLFLRMHARMPACRHLQSHAQCTHIQTNTHKIDNHANNLVYWHPLRRASTRRFSIRVFLINPFVIKQRDQRSVILGQIYSHQSSEIFHSPGRKKECGKEKKQGLQTKVACCQLKKKTDKNIVIFATVLANNCDDIKG